MKTKNIFIFKILLILFSFTQIKIEAATLIDLESMAQDFVLETIKIDIPGYPDAFNPSITRLNDSFLMCFRFRDPATSSTNKIGFVWLDENFQLKSGIQELDIKINYSAYPTLLSYAQDPRLITVGGHLYMVYSNLIGSSQGIQRRMFIASLHINLNGHILMQEPVSIENFVGEINQRQEKNWPPFDYNGNLLLAYSLNPHRIMAPDFQISAQNIASTQGNIQWSWGELRGGTPALKIGDEYLAFFHSSKDMATLNSNGKKMTHYFMGAYTFSNDHPFAITKMSPSPIIGVNFYNGPIYATWKPLRVVFPGGYVYDDKFIWIVYGRQDHETCVVKIDRNGLFNSLIPVETVSSQ